MAIFTLSCFGLLLYLWSAFGGPVPLKPHGYRFHASFAEATQLAQEADVRISGVNVGKVKKIDLGDDGRTDATIELDDKYAPIPQDSRAILRQKTLLGETYVELTPGTKSAPQDPRERPPRDRTGRADGRARRDPPRRSTRRRARASRSGSRTSAQGIEGHGAGLLGRARQPADRSRSNTNKVLKILNSQERAIREAIKNTGVVFDALTERDGQLADWITNSNQLLATTGAARRTRSARCSGRSRRSSTSPSSTLRALEAYAENTDAADARSSSRSRTQLSSFLVNAKGLAPNFNQFFIGQGQLIPASVKGLPASVALPRRHAQPARPARPVPAQLQPVPRVPRACTSARSRRCFANDTATLQATDQIGDNRVHYLRLTSPVNPEALVDLPAAPGLAAAATRTSSRAATTSSRAGSTSSTRTCCGTTGFPTLGPAGPTFTEDLRNRDPPVLPEQRQHDRAACQQAGAVHVRRRDHGLPARHRGPEAEPVGSGR